MSRMNGLRATRIRQAGVGLVEIMVASLVGAIVVIAVVQIFTANKQTFRMQDAMAITQETGTFALDFIARDALRAGFPGGENTPSAFDWGETANDDPNGNDTLAIVYSANAPDVEGRLCTGDMVGNIDVRLRNRYWVTDDGELVCQGDEETATDVFTAVGTPQVLVENVESFQVMFGVDLSYPLRPEPAGCPAQPAPAAGTPPGEPTAYINASLVQSAINRGAAANPAPPTCQVAMSERQVVRTIRIGLLVRTAGIVDAVVPADKTYTILDQVLAAPDITPDDGHLRRLFTKTVALRNIEETL